MRRLSVYWKAWLQAVIAVVLLAPFCPRVAVRAEVQVKPIAWDEFLDKLKGAWAGQMIGVSYGAPYEFAAQGRIFDGPIREWKPEYVSNSIGQDDLYVEMTFLEAIEKYGLDISTRRAGEVFGESKYGLAHANAVGRENIRKGIPAPLSGNPKYNPHADDIDFQIESDLLGIICPGMPQVSNSLCDRFGHIMNYGDGVYGGMFTAAMYTQAYFESDIRRIVEAALEAIPARSKYARTIRDVLAWYDKYPQDWTRCWKELQDKWGEDDKCPDGLGTPFNIDAKLNGAYVVMGLLYGGGDFSKTLEVSTRCGQDNDCNPSSAAGVLGTILGYGKIPAQYTNGIPAISDQNFSFTNYNFKTLVAVCSKMTVTIVEKEGGRLEERDGKKFLLVPVQPPKAPAKLEVYKSSPEVAANELLASKLSVVKISRGDQCVVEKWKKLLPDEWDGGEHLLFQSDWLDDFFTLKLPVEISDAYTPELIISEKSDCGIFDVLIDGKKVAPEINGYGGYLRFLRRVALEPIALSRGGHEITFRVRGRDPNSSGFRIAIRSVVLNHNGPFVRDWKTVGPFDNAGNTELDSPYGPERQEVFLDRYRGKGDKEVSWKEVHADANGFVDLTKVYPDEDTTWSIAYAVCYISSPERRKVYLGFGSDDGVKAWLNGKQVLRVKASRGASPDQDQVTARLNKGRNVLMLKIDQGVGAWGFYVRISDPENTLEYPLPEI